MAHTYSHLYRLPTTGLRFFTVYGPWGRPDMAAWLFTKAILAGEPIKVFNHGKMRRDFTYVTDVAEAVVRVMDVIPEPNPEWDSDCPDPATSNAPFRIYNVGNSEPVELNHFIAVLETLLGKTAIRENLPLQPGDVLSTSADTSDLEAATGFRPQTSIEDGLAQFVAWYREYYRRVSQRVDRGRFLAVRRWVTLERPRSSVTSSIVRRRVSDSPGSRTRRPLS